MEKILSNLLAYVRTRGVTATAATIMSIIETYMARNRYLRISPPVSSMPNSLEVIA